MAGGSIDYSLGLATRSFLGPLGIAQGALAAFTSFAVGAGGVMAGVFSQIEKGGQLVDLRSRTGENIDTLFKLQEGFKIVGLEASKVPSTIFQLQRALSGTSEAGESTAGVIAALGLSFKGLRSQDTVGQLTAIAGKLAQLAPSDAAGLAAKLFGRGGSGDILQMSRDMDGFNEALRETASVAAAFQRFSGTFDEIGDRLGILKTKASGLFVEIAGGVAPALLGLVNSLRGFDFQSLGKGIADAFSVIPGAIAQQRIPELFGAAIEAGIEQGVNALGKAIGGLAAALPSLLSGALNFQSLFTNLKMQAAGVGFGKLWSGAGDLAMNIPGLGGAGLLLKSLGKNAQESATFIKGGNRELIDGILQSFQQAFKAGVGANGNLFGNDASKRFQDLVAALLPKVGPVPAPGNAKNGPPVLAFGGSAGGEADALTRIGFFSGGSNAGIDFQRRTATAVEKLVALQQEARRAPGADFKNQ